MEMVDRLDPSNTGEALADLVKVDIDRDPFKEDVDAGRGHPDGLDDDETGNDE